MLKNKELALNLLKQRINGQIKITYNEISIKTGYSRMQLNRLANEIEKKDIDDLLTHGNKGRKPSITAPTKKLNLLSNLNNNIPKLVYHNSKIFIMKILFLILKWQTTSNNLI